MSSVSPISSLADVQATLRNDLHLDQIGQTLQALSTAVFSGDTAGAGKALAALQTLASNPASAPVSGSNPLHADFATMSQALASGDSVAIRNAFVSLQKDLSILGSLSPTLQKGSPAPTAATHMETSAASLGYVVNLLSTSPETIPIYSRTALAVESDLRSSVSAEEAAKIAVQVNEIEPIGTGAQKSMFLAGLFLIPILILLLLYLF